MAALTALLDRYGVIAAEPEPDDPPAVPRTFRECSQRAASLERENIAMYDRLLADVRDADVRAVFENLRAASKDHHLRAFERWAGGTTPARPIRPLRGR